MKILLLSDSHLYNEILDHVLKNNSADLIIHCGDSIFQEDEPLLKRMITVRGNHDLEFLPIKKTIYIENYKCLITHGQCYNIYAGYETLYQLMKKENYDICFHGHTHVPYMKNYKGKLFINPGSIMFNRGQTNCGSYAIVNINDKQISVKFYNSRTLQQIPQTMIDANKAVLDEFKELIDKYKKKKNWPVRSIF